MLEKLPRLPRRLASLACPGCPVASWPQPWRSGSSFLGQSASDLAPTVLLPSAPLQQVRWPWDRSLLQWAASAGLSSRWDGSLRLRPRSPARSWRPGPLALSAPLPPAAAGVSVLPPASPFQLVRRQGLRLRRPLFPGSGVSLGPCRPSPWRPGPRLPGPLRPCPCWTVLGWSGSWKLGPRRPLFPGPGEWLRPRLPGSRRPRERPRHRRPVVAWL